MKGPMPSYVILVFALLLEDCSAFPSFQKSIPNGANVNNPCDPLVLWPGVGHWNVDGGGDRNPFGKQFEANAYKWTAALCKADSDGDGRTNGQELGDPNCAWTPGALPSRRTDITHPGICEPVESLFCKQKNTFLRCKSSDLCPLLYEPDVKNISLTFPRSNIPAQGTNYFCRVFKFPADRLYDMIATQPIVDNKLVVHHMQMYGCENDINLPHTDGKIFECTMGVPGHCTNIISLWSMGADGDCLTEEYGYRIGFDAVTRVSGYKYAALEIHWTNYDLLTDQYDSSGLNIFYTPRLRPNKAAILQLGQYYLNIPPRTKQTVAQATCSSTCSKKTLKTPVKIAQVAVHAHLLGKKGSVELHRNGQFLKYILAEYAIDFNYPQMFLLDPPIDYLPGDVIKVNCFFDSTDRTTVTSYGDGTRDEMCIGYFVYYPAQEPIAFHDCGQWKDVSLCNDAEELAPCTSTLLATIKRNVLANCVSGCTTQCKSAVDSIFLTECGSDAYLAQLAKDPNNYDLLDVIDKCASPAKASSPSDSNKMSRGSENGKKDKGKRRKIADKVEDLETRFQFPTDKIEETGLIKKISEELEDLETRFDPRNEKKGKKEKGNRRKIDGDLELLETRFDSLNDKKLALDSNNQDTPFNSHKDRNNQKMKVLNSEKKIGRESEDLETRFDFSNEKNDKEEDGTGKRWINAGEVEDLEARFDSHNNKKVKKAQDMSNRMQIKGESDTLKTLSNSQMTKMLFNEEIEEFLDSLD